MHVHSIHMDVGTLRFQLLLGKSEQNGTKMLNYRRKIPPLSVEVKS